MRVRFVTTWERYTPGDRAEFPAHEARRLIERKVAVQDMARDPHSVKTHEEAGDENKLANRDGR